VRGEEGEDGGAAEGEGVGRGGGVEEGGEGGGEGGGEVGEGGHRGPGKVVGLRGSGMELGWGDWISERNLFVNLWKDEVTCFTRFARDDGFVRQFVEPLRVGLDL